ncbi:MAG TPA: CTP synthase [Candidatus Deferrimicrobium sp.]|nr:CTP synthase [Candidatus Deferrimicrobium sp.]
MTKFIFITGGVMSGIGKGVTSASIGKLFQFRNFQVSMIKIDPYLNIDPGTLNPVEHGEVFICDEVWNFEPVKGQVYPISEIDQDFGTYERFLNRSMHPSSNITSGQVYLTVLLREREGVHYLGKTIQIIPHITNEIKRRIRDIERRENPDVLITEIGGTVGDIEAMPFLEAIRQFRLEEPEENTTSVHVTLVPFLDAVGEFKSKPTQHSVKALQAAGIQPNIIVCRSSKPLPDSVRRKVSLYSNIPYEAVISSPDIEVIYELPILYEQQGLGDYLINRLRMNRREPQYKEWQTLVDHFKNPHAIVNIALPGKYIDIKDSYVSINESLKHASMSCGARVNIEWLDTEAFEKNPEQIDDALSGFDGILVTPGFGMRGVEGMIMSASYALKNKVPYLGICFGAQLFFIAFCRDILGLKNANSTEVNPGTADPVVDLLPEQKEIKEKGGTMRLGAHPVHIKPETLLYKAYQQEKVLERFRHRYHIIPKYAAEAEKKGLVVSAYDATGRIINAIEYGVGENWMVGTQFHPEYKSHPTRPGPIYCAFIQESLKYRAKQEREAI